MSSGIPCFFVLGSFFFFNLPLLPAQFRLKSVVEKKPKKETKNVLQIILPQYWQTSNRFFSPILFHKYIFLRHLALASSLDPISMLTLEKNKKVTLHVNHDSHRTES